MSRSWTPQEHYRSYYYLLKERGQNLRAIGGRNNNDDFGFLNLCFNSVDGKLFPFYDAKYIEDMKKYRELSYLFSGFEKVWSATAEHLRKRKKVFDKLEEDLVLIEKHDIAGTLDRIVNKVDNVLFNWYIGDIEMYTQEVFICDLSNHIYMLIMGKSPGDIFYNDY